MRRLYDSSFWISSGDVGGLGVASNSSRTSKRVQIAWWVRKARPKSDGGQEDQMFKFSFSLALWFAEDSYQFFGGEREIGQFTIKIELVFSTIIIFIFDLKKKLLHNLLPNKTNQPQPHSKKKFSYNPSRIKLALVVIVSAHPYCARNSHATICIERALSNKVNNNRANGHRFDFAWI